MSRISQMPPPDALTGLELVPMLQGGGLDGSGNRAAPILAYGSVPRGQVLALRRPMAADLGSTSDGDPGAGGVRWGDVDPDAAGELYVSHADVDSGALASELAALQTGGFVYVQGSADSDARSTWQKWQVTSVAPQSGYTRIGVALQASSGGFADADPVELTLQQPTPSPGTDRNVVTAVASAGGATTLDASLGDYFTTALSEDTAIAVTNVPAGCTLALSITQDAVAREVAWPAAWNWGGPAPVMPAGAGAVLDVIITTFDAGGTFIASSRVRS